MKLYGDYGDSGSSVLGALDGLEPYFIDTTHLGVRAGRCRDSTGTRDIVLGTDSQITLATNGLDGFDGASLPAGPGCLDVWALVVAGTTRLLLAAQTGIVGTYGETAKRRLGAVMFGDNQQPIRFTAERLGTSLTVRMDDDGTHRTGNVLSAGTAATMTGVSCAGNVPLRATSALVTLTSLGTGAAGNFGATTSAAASPSRAIFGTNVIAIAELPLVAQSFAYLRTAGALYVDVGGYREDCSR